MATKVKHYIPTDAMSPAIVVLRKVDTQKLGDTYQFLGDEVIHWAGTENSVRSSDTVWYDEGYLLNDLPRESNANAELIRATLGFAVARSDNGQILAKYPATQEGLKAADKAAKGATYAINVEVELDEEPSEEFLASIPKPIDEDFGELANA